jgi:hypothetical protein
MDQPCIQLPSHQFKVCAKRTAHDLGRAAVLSAAMRSTQGCTFGPPQSTIHRRQTVLVTEPV